ncbi:low-density lipoprotein receptor-related protein 1B-like [Symsagittifera roscoffensis]|uniref:low-density lipoprotein receptor-related protein 1B-like n=1 Tax=Symsagittifera roscoffensis TaxID=84072 RepID=UPI00307C840F
MFQWSKKIISINSEAGTTNCAANEFLCGFNDGTRPEANGCKANTTLCDGVNDCGDFSDEYNCFLTHPQYSCFHDDGTTTYRSVNVAKASLCDGVNDCGATQDLTRFRDELGCHDASFTCTSTQFACRNPAGTIVQCVDYTKVCDGYNDCGQYGGATPWHYQDEAGCDVSCASNEFKCPASGTCMLADGSGTAKVCDGVNDCEDMRDELGCNSNCGPTEVYCGGVLCTDKVCDMNNDCGPDYHYVDEVGCYQSAGECGASGDKTKVQCKDNSTCVTLAETCDGDNDCDDFSDELNCHAACGLSQFTCNTTLAGGHVCVNEAVLCDGVPDCNVTRYNDELGCSTCTPAQFLCDDGSCIADTLLCDNNKDCPTMEDEANCDDSCANDEYVCPITGLCLQLDTPYAAPAIVTKICDKKNDCGAYEDELLCDADCNAANPLKCGDYTTYATGAANCVAAASICDQKNDCGAAYPYADEDGCYESASQKCPLGQFLCKDLTTCVPKADLCEGGNDCGDFTDEGGCHSSCTNEQFHCATSGTCVPITAYGTAGTCDGKNDCGELADKYADEIDCDAACNGYKCATTGTCITNMALLCNGDNDCGAYEDEKHCNAACTKDEFRCADDSKCIDEANICDGVNDCGDHSDEMNCGRDSTTWNSCNDPDEFYCGAIKGCIADTLLCNQENDCGGVNGEEYSDELGCPGAQGCNGTQFACEDDTTCVNKAKICDGENDCDDYSDEEGCTVAPSDVCRNDEFYCSGTAGTFNFDKCIDSFHSGANTETCDGVNNCGSTGFEDELGCKDATINCDVDEWLCRKDSTCVDITTPNYFCDGLNNCGDFSDEDHCDDGCGEGEYKCPNRNRCVKMIGGGGREVCDGDNDCGDFADEIGCTNGPNGCAPNQFDCGAIGGADDQKCIASGDTCNGDNDCFYTNSYVDEIGCGTCNDDEFRCKISTPQQCVKNTTLCDGINDCHDFSDEQHCAFGTCGANKDHFHCNNGSNVCVPEGAECDGYKDCDLGEDEHGCFIGTSTTQSCDSSSFYCGLGATNVLPADNTAGCVATSKLCDGYNDCDNFGDEINCDDKLANTCGEKQYECFETANRCVDADPGGTNLVCNGENDCGSFEDELGCGTTCGIYEMTCANGNCITTALDGSAEQRCDTFNDCGDYSDEFLCDDMINLTPDTYTCTGNDNEFQCWDGSCIKDSETCDGKTDCPSYDDELNCLGRVAGCGSKTDFACYDDSKCVTYDKLCDGTDDCGDNSDEADCNNPAGLADCPVKTLYDGAAESTFKYTVNIGPTDPGYGAWLNCDLTFSFTNNVCISFTTFDLQINDTKTGLCRDYVEIEVGGVTNGPYCGATNPFPAGAGFNGGPGAAVVRFRSDLNAYADGITIVAEDCGK